MLKRNEMRMGLAEGGSANEEGGKKRGEVWKSALREWIGRERERQ